MFEYLKEWPKILVTGPQRSGTRIATKMIAADTGRLCVEEEDFHVDSLNELWGLLRRLNGCVVQCPALCAYVSLLAARYEFADPGLFVVMMRRNLDDIKASEERIDWKWEPPELMRYGELDGPASVIKYLNWDQWQREELEPRCLDLAYESLSSHPLWIPKEQRAGFTPRQTS